jgi:hypothetical protein
MPGCLLTSSLLNTYCKYAVTGCKALYVANYHPMSATPSELTISYTVGTGGLISAITLPSGEKFYKLEANDGTITFQDQLQMGGSGGKWRMHTVNAFIPQLDVTILGEVQPLSVGRFLAIVVDRRGNVIVLGRTGGLTAPADGMSYNSGAAESDASGWQLILQGSSMEEVVLGTSEAIITPTDLTSISVNNGDAKRIMDVEKVEAVFTQEPIPTVNGGAVDTPVAPKSINILP